MTVSPEEIEGAVGRLRAASAADGSCPGWIVVKQADLSVVLERVSRASFAALIPVQGVSAVVGQWSVGDYAQRIEHHPLVGAGEVHCVTEIYRGGYLGFGGRIGGEWNPSGWRKVAAPDATPDTQAAGDAAQEPAK